MFVAAAICPHPPLLVPELAGRAAVELDGLRSSCLDAIAVVLAEGVDELVVVGADPRAGTSSPTAGASMHPYGVDLRVGGPDDQLPLALAVGAWLLRRAGNTAARYVGIEPDASLDRCLQLGRTLAAGSTRTGLLIMGDGSARRTGSSPGPYDPRALLYDERVICALADGRADLLAGLDPELARELMVAGRAAWQVLAGALLSAWPRAEDEPPQAIDARVIRAEAPYGVGYFVAVWIDRPRGPAPIAGPTAAG